MLGRCSVRRFAGSLTVCRVEREVGRLTERRASSVGLGHAPEDARQKVCDMLRCRPARPDVRASSVRFSTGLLAARSLSPADTCGRGDIIACARPV